MTNDRYAAPDLRGKVAVVTGASRGAGRGIALELGVAGATVYVTARSTREKPAGSYGQILALSGLDAVPGTIEDTADQKSIDIPALLDAPKAAPAPAFRDEVVPIDRPGRRALGLTITGLGAVGLGFGAWFGIRALDAKSKSDDECLSGCTTAGADLSRDAVRYGNISTVTFATGLVGVAVGAYLVSLI